MGAAMGPGPDVGSVLFAHTGELKLSDQQVTRLAAIARRTADRRQTMRRSFDSAMTSRRGQGRDSAARGRMGPRPELLAAGERMREQAHADLREALSVLTPDQQATAWETIAMRGPAGGRGGRGGPPRRGGEMPGARMRGGPGAGGPGMAGPGMRGASDVQRP
ncbi:MAG: hypothetical protein JWL95_2431 [Gemmatimonadetes bacterium]|nr:hypothetical protein [Gemmatimonadota bacterium]